MRFVIRLPRVDVVRIVVFEEGGARFTLGRPLAETAPLRYGAAGRVGEYFQGSDRVAFPAGRHD